MENISGPKWHVFFCSEMVFSVIKVFLTLNKRKNDEEKIIFSSLRELVKTFLCDAKLWLVFYYFFFFNIYKNVPQR